MLLKSLKLQGFKTFPDQTKLSFGPGITAVVGPNGSGKSNISDAIRWVLGEQSCKTLRCSRMEDVIFNGTPARKSQGYAQVTLTIDNKDRRLPFGEDEVAITRRYYRSGDSEYLINKAVVRLKDIHELFMDTGLGRDGYSIIGQGKIDSIVASRSEDRREIFEEAAGISRYRYRKGEAEKKLNQTEENLLRLRDILSELEARVGPLEEQAKKAKDYLAYADEKRVLEIGLWLNTLEKSGKVLREQEDKILVARNQDEEVENQIQAIQAQEETVFSEMNSHTAKVDERRREIQSLQELSSQKEHEASLLSSDVSHNEELISRVETQIQEANSSADSIDEEIEKRREAILQKEQQEETDRRELASCEQALQALQDEAGKYLTEGETLSGQIAALTDQAGEAKLSGVTAASSITEIEARLTKVQSDITQRLGSLHQANAALKDYQQMLEDTNERIDGLTNTVKGYELRLSSRRGKLAESKKLTDQLSLDAEEKLRRANLLRELERNLEGFQKSVKTVMKESQRGTLSGVHGPVSRLFQVSNEYAVAIETALGGATQNLVVSTEQDAKRAIQLLKQRDSGRATFLPLSTIKGNVLKEPGLEDCMGFVGVASRLCRFEPQYQGVIDSLLGRVAVAESLDDAVAIAKRFHYRFRIVTLDGQVVNAGGSLTGGSLARNSGLLSRVGEIEKYEKEAAGIQEKLKKAQEEYRQLQAEVSKNEAALLGAQGELSSAHEERIHLEAEQKNRHSERESLQQAITDLQNERDQSNARLKELKQTLAESQKIQQEAEGKIAAVEAKLSQITGSQAAFTEKREAVSQKMQELRLQLLSLEKDKASLEAEIESMESRKQGEAGRINQLEEEIQELRLKNQELKKEIEKRLALAQEFQEKAKAVEESIEALNQERLGLEKQSAQLRAEEREKQSQRELTGRELARLEERKVNLQKEYDEIISRLWEEYELTRRQAEETVGRVEEPSKAQKRLNELKNKIKSLGTVNVAAIEEFQEVSQRYAFMQEQVGDVEKSREELLKLIRELTQNMRSLFVTRFEEINQHFGTTFQELFGGGGAQLKLSDPDDILNSGIDIYVQPPGKIVSHLELLSGGEKALVAICLYFSIMKVSPAPFCVLDEIEAALDDVNVTRFATYLRRMNDNTQFIVITHRRGTMEEADVLYGVTMQDEGVSKLLELRASEIESKLGMKA